MDSLRLTRDTASIREIELHLRRCNSDFTPPLDSRVDIAAYATKIRNRARTFEAWNTARLVGLVAVYLDGVNLIGFVTSVSVDGPHRNHGLARVLVKGALTHLQELRYSSMALDVSQLNHGAICLYRSIGFQIVSINSGSFHMSLKLNDVGTEGGYGDTKP